MKIKKLTALVLSVLLCAVSMLCACGKKAETDPDAPPVPEKAFRLSDIAEELYADVNYTVRTAAEEDIPAARSRLVAQGAAEPVSYKDITLPSYSAAGVMCADTGEILFVDNGNEHIAPASMTKVLTACVALKYVDKNELCSVGTELDFVRMDSSMAYIGLGEVMTMYDLLSGMLMCSGNDAAYTVAANTARLLNPDKEMEDNELIDYFMILMNKFAIDIGMTSSNFVNPDGWDSESQFSTVNDLLILGEYALTIPEIREIVGCAHRDLTISSGESYSWDNSNRMLRKGDMYYSPEAVGMKTGSTIMAGSSLIGAFRRGELTYITVAAGCDSDDDRYLTTLGLMEKYVKPVD